MGYVGYHRPTREEIRAILEKEGTAEISLVATPIGNDSEIVAQIRCILLNSPTSAEVSIMVHDDWQNQGLGTALMAILACASRAGVERVAGIIGLSNDRIIHVCNKLRFSNCYDTVKMGVSLSSRATKNKAEERLTQRACAGVWFVIP
jgi:GNAT superfamily N-acetyltransferase